VQVKPHIADENEQSIRTRLEELKVQLLYLTKRFSDQYPDVRKTRSEIAELESQLAAVAAERKSAPPDNPSYISLAFTFSLHYDHTVLLVDCDLRKQSIHKDLGYSNSPNIIDYLVDNVPLHTTMVRPDVEKIVVISGACTRFGSALP
jgi:hypothetical protein